MGQTAVDSLYLYQYDRQADLQYLTTTLYHNGRHQHAVVKHSSGSWVQHLSPLLWASVALSVTSPCADPWNDRNHAVGIEANVMSKTIGNLRQCGSYP